jgi:hypothetical protein
MYRVILWVVNVRRMRNRNTLIQYIHMCVQRLTYASAEAILHLHHVQAYLAIIVGYCRSVLADAEDSESASGPRRSRTQ